MGLRIGRHWPHYNHILVNMTDKIKFIAIEDHTVYHEGDQRSRDHPGHGYPAYSETVDHVTYFTSDAQVIEWAEERYKRGNRDKYKLFKCEPVEVHIKPTVVLK